MDDVVTPLLKVSVHWMIRTNLQEIVEIERASFDYPWTEAEFLQMIRKRNCIGLVAETSDETIAGFAVYELLPSHVQILNVAVHPDYRRQGVGYQIIELIAKKSSRRKTGQ